jgi:hypothetical protein
MNFEKIIFLLLALIFWFFGLHALITFLSDLKLNVVYGFFSIGLLLPGSVLLLAAFQSKIKFLSNDSERT